MSQATMPQQQALDPMLATALRLTALLVVGMLLFALTPALGLRGTDIAIAGVAILGSLLALAPIVVDQGRPVASRQLLLTLTGVSYFGYYYVPVV
ncbi:MAG: hypothetical protein JRH16_23830, partial [Deltaproteobacteria bacterium]|nr:hypothetical protein [Deltaproteobacteria bacterium]